MQGARVLMAVVFSVFAVSVAACSGTVTPADGDASADATGDLATDIPFTCPATFSAGGACSVPDATCQLPEACIQCGHDLWDRWARPCTCSGGHWLCAVGDCFAPGPGVYSDPACTIPSVRDAGDDAIDASDVTPDVTDAAPSDACPARPDVPVVPSEAGVCPLGTTRCGITCVDLSADPSNCGSCGNTCFSYQLCLVGTCSCECAAGLTVCGGSCNACMCTDLQHDTAHCGSCAVACAPGQTCVAGMCQ